MTRDRRSFAFFLIAVIVAVAAAGCSGPTGPSETVPLAQRIAGVWRLAERQLPGETAVAPPAGSTFTFEVVEGRAAVKADCNQCGGNAVIGSDTVTVGPAVACTKAYCTLSAPYDTTYVQVLSGDNDANVDGGTLTLRSARGTLRFRR
jgi:heat shock protein HslJ